MSGALSAVELLKKVHAAVARRGSECFWKLTELLKKCKYQERLRFGALLEVELLKNRTRLWREANLEINMLKAHQVWSAYLWKLSC